MKNKRVVLLPLLIVTSMLHAHTKNTYYSRLQPDPRKTAFEIGFNSLKHQTVDQQQSTFINPNPDTTNIANYAGSFHKLLHHQASDGVLSSQGQKNFERLLKALRTGKQEDFNAIELSSGSQRVFINPQAGFAFSVDGVDSELVNMPIPPSLQSAHAAAEMFETYMNILTRDVKFYEYGTGQGSDDDGKGNSLTEKLASVLHALGEDYKGPRNQQGAVNASVLFRGVSSGDLIGPYVSQFLLEPLYPLFPSGCAPFVGGLIGVGNLDQDIIAIEQHIPIPQKREFGVSWNDFLALQNGTIPKAYDISDYNQTELRYPITGRDMGSIVHTDSPYQPYYNALNILAYRDTPRSPNFPYNNGAILHEGDGITMGVPEAYAMLGEVTIRALKAAWAQKWRNHLRLRPEAMAGLIHQAKVTNSNPYNLHSCLFYPHNGVDVLQLVRDRNKLQSLQEYDPQTLLNEQEVDTYLLPQMYPEGSPAHPEYPSGHATIAGACVTVLKAIFAENTPIEQLFEPVIVDPQNEQALLGYTGADRSYLTVGSELDKLASNIAIARNFGGVHFRSAGEEGIRLGEQIAINYLETIANQYHEEGFTGFELTKRNGTRIKITAQGTTPL